MSAFQRKKAEELHWHKSCYALFADKGKISRLRKFLDSTNAKPSPLEISPALRSKPSFTNWELVLSRQGTVRKREHSVQLY